MPVQALTRHCRMSPKKVREVAREIQGMNAAQAAETLRFIPRKSARLIEKTLKSAIANAENNENLVAENLVVSSCTVDEGPMFKRFRPTARGMAHPYRKRTSHIKVILSESTSETLASTSES
jgi:large subunit ribosomal protein L22